MYSSRSARCTPHAEREEYKANLFGLQSLDSFLLEGSKPTNVRSWNPW